VRLAGSRRAHTDLHPILSVKPINCLLLKARPSMLLSGNLVADHKLLKMCGYLQLPRWWFEAGILSVLIMAPPLVSHERAILSPTDIPQRDELDPHAPLRPPKSREGSDKGPVGSLSLSGVKLRA